MSYRSSAGDLASDTYYLKTFAVSERLQAAISEPLAPFTTIQLQEAATKLQSENFIDRASLSQLVTYLQQEHFYCALQHYLGPLRFSGFEHGLFVGLIADTLGYLYSRWNTEFYGSALDALKEKIKHEEGSVNKDLYAKIIPIIQSSGTGKSRLVDELGKEFLSISFVFRLDGESGYPPGDPRDHKFHQAKLYSERHT